MDSLQFMGNMQYTAPDQIKAQYMDRLRKSRIAPDMLDVCEELDMSATGKDFIRNLRSIKRSYADDAFACIYFQINPGKNWSATVGLISEVPSWVEQEEFFQAQTAVFECRGNSEANALFFNSRRLPCEDTVEEYLIAMTIAEFKKALEKETVEKPIYVGIAHSAICFAV